MLTIEECESAIQDLEMTCNTTPKRISTESNDNNDALWPVKKKLSGYLEKKEMKTCHISRNSTIPNVKKFLRITQDKTIDNVFPQNIKSIKDINSTISNQLKYDSWNSSFINLIKDNERGRLNNFSRTIVNKLGRELIKVKNHKNTQRIPKKFTKERNYK